MTSSILQLELANLIQESKRKNTDLRNAAETSLNELKGLPSTSEAQLAADLIRRPHFISPFVFACKSRNAKAAGIGVVCLQRLVSSRAIPEDKLKEVLEALKESIALSFDVQLKILQALSSLVQNYGEIVQGDLLRTTLEICSTLQTTKTASVASTAAATFQQLVVSVFERVTDEDASDLSPIATVPGLDGPVQIRPTAHDALQIFTDLCLYIEGEKLQILYLKSISPAFILELIESILTNNAEVFHSHPEQIQVLRQRLMPLIVKLLSDRLSFSITVRVARILFLLLKRHLAVLARECEIALALLTHLMEPDPATPWKRILVMEIFRGLYADFSLVRTIFKFYDQQAGRKNILQMQMGAMVRIASEKPSLIGISRQSTMPSSQVSPQGNVDEQATLEAGGVAGVIGTPVTMADGNATGISSQWSSIRTACIDQLDKSEPQAIPETYIYALILNSISSFSEGIAKFILPLTVPSEGRGKRRHKVLSPIDQETGSPLEPEVFQRTDSAKTDIQSINKKSTVPVNPLDLESHPQFQSIQISASIIGSVWAPVLATCSTFFNAALDSDFYHNLVRSFQKLAHVAGLLRLSTPRDAFLTTLGKAAVPSDVASFTSVPPPTPGADPLNDRKHLTVDSPTVASPIQASASPRKSFENANSSLSTRNLLCLRALLNLGIALGPTLDESAWSILLETLQQADLVITFAMRLNARQISLPSHSDESESTGDPNPPKGNLGNEVLAVETAATRMFESTSEYPNSCFFPVLNALLKLSGHVGASDVVLLPENRTPTTPRTPFIPKRPGRMHQSSRSVSISLDKTKVQNDEMRFVLAKADQLLKANTMRFSQSDPEETGWNLVATTLVEIAYSLEVEPVSRVKAVEVLNHIIIGSMSSMISEEAQLREMVQLRGLTTLSREVMPHDGAASPVNRNIQLEIHDSALTSLNLILEHSGESLVAGWDIVFELICSVFGKPEVAFIDAAQLGEGLALDEKSQVGQRTTYSTRSPKLVRTAFKSLQLVGSDFLELLPIRCISMLIDSLAPFSLQQDDFNISLTTTNFFWNVSDFLQVRIEELAFNPERASAQTFKSDEIADEENQAASWSILWLRLLLRMRMVTSDARPEVRNGAVRTMYRIFDANGQKMPSSSWHRCLDMVLFPMLDDGTLEAFGSLQVVGDADLRHISPEWQETSIILIRGFAKLVSNFLGQVISDPGFPSSWDRMLGLYRTILGMECPELSAAIFVSLAEILLQVNEAEVLGDRPLQMTWKLWDHGYQGASLRTKGNNYRDNQDLISAYLEAYSNLYRLSKQNLNSQHVSSIIRNLRGCIHESVHARYASDVNQATSVQRTTLDSLKNIISEIEGSQSLVVDCIGGFVDLAVHEPLKNQDATQPTYIAFSKASTDLLEWCIVGQGIRDDLFTDGILSRVLAHLSTFVIRKYNWAGKDKAPPLWQKATTAALNILGVCVPYVSCLESPHDENMNTFWMQVVKIAGGILNPDSSLAPSRATILADQIFDTDSFIRLHTLITPYLCSPKLPDPLRIYYARTLFEASLIHTPHGKDLDITRSLRRQVQLFRDPQHLIFRDDSMSANFNPLSSIHKVRMGSTFDPPPSPRTSISYTCLTTLFFLGSSKPTSNSAASLAHAALPFIILRAALPIKSYVADQPLRGLMPQPLSQRKELLFVLDMMVKLKSLDEAVPAMEGKEREGREGKRHLLWVLPLVEKAIGVAGRDVNGEVLAALRGVLRAVVGTENDEGDR